MLIFFNLQVNEIFFVVLPLYSRPDLPKEAILQCMAQLATQRVCFMKFYMHSIRSHKWRRFITHADFCVLECSFNLIMRRVFFVYLWKSFLRLLQSVLNSVCRSTQTFMRNCRKWRRIHEWKSVEQDFRKERKNPDGYIVHLMGFVVISLEVEELCFCLLWEDDQRAISYLSILSEYLSYYYYAILNWYTLVGHWSCAKISSHN